MASVIGQLRAIVPHRPLTLAEGLRVAERQAAKLLDHLDLDAPPVPETAIAGLPRIQVERVRLNRSAGGTDWMAGQWVIVLNAADIPTRQRFSLCHELKHVLDYPIADVAYPETMGMSSHDRIEQVCDYFAGCLLMPRPWLKRAWGNGLQNPRTLAVRFGVSQAAMNVRLRQIGLTENRTQPRCGYVAATRHHSYPTATAMSGRPAP